jgi:hypothetical protein
LWRRKSGRFDDRAYFLAGAASTISTAPLLYCHPEPVEGSLNLALLVTRIVGEKVRDPSLRSG